MGVLLVYGDGDHQKGRAVLGVNLGRPIVTNGDLLCSYVEVGEPIELSFGVVSGVSPGIGVLDGGPHDQSGRRGFGILFPH